jgi:hypothetical protein
VIRCDAQETRCGCRSGTPTPLASSSRRKQTNRGQDGRARSQGSAQIKRGQAWPSEARRGDLPAVATTAATAAATTTTTTTATAVAAVTTTAIATTAATTVVTAAAATAAIATTAATTAAAAITATAAEATAAAAEATATAAAATTTALLALLGFVHAKRATVEGAAVHALDRLGGFFGSSHGDEREAAGAAGLAIGDQVDITYGSEFLERSTDAISIGIERKISNVQTSVHRLLDLAQVTTFRPEGAMVLQAGVSKQRGRGCNSH